MRRVTLKLSPLDGRVLPSAVTGDIATIFRGDYCVGGPVAACGEVGARVDLGSKPGGAGDGVTPFGGRTGIGGEF